MLQITPEMRMTVLYNEGLFCQLFGRMIDLPPNMPHFCNDLRQLASFSPISRARFPLQDPEGLHNALSDARWNARLHVILETELYAQ